MKKSFLSVALSFVVALLVALPSHAFIALIMSEAYFVAGGCAVVVVGMSGRGYVRPPGRYYPSPASSTEFDRNTGMIKVSDDMDGMLGFLLLWGIVLLDQKEGKLQFGPIQSMEAAKSLGLTVTEDILEEYNSEVPKINAAINDLSSRGVSYSPAGVEWAQAQWAEYIRRGVISENAFLLARQILNLEKNQGITSL